MNIDTQSRLNANKTYQETVIHMTLFEIKKLFLDNGLSDNIKLEQKTFIQALKLMNAW